jgi:uncharacterized membrane protein YGL010W
MKSLLDQLSNYASYHRDPRNITTHLVGIPMILVAVTILLARPNLNVMGLMLSPAVAVALVTALYYLRLDRPYGLVMTLVLVISLAIAQYTAGLPTAQWLAWGLGLFVVGWIIQFIGHIYEGRKPAFVDDLMGLIIGPLFVAAEIGFALGLRTEVREAIDARSGPVRRRGTPVQVLKP